MATPKVLLKRSSVAGRVPAAGDLQYGELAINFEDGKIYYKTASNQIAAFVDSARVQSIADAVEQQAASMLDSAEVTALIDADYINSKLDTSSFLDSSEAIQLIDSDYVTARVDASVLLDSAEIKSMIDSDYIQDKVTVAFINSLVGVDAETLGGQAANYYNNWNNIYNQPHIFDSDEVSAIAGDAALDSSEVIALIDSDYVRARFGDSASTATDAYRLNGQAGSYYLDYNNATNKPTILDTVDVSLIITNDVDKAFVDALNINAFRLDGYSAGYFINKIDSNVAGMLDSTEAIALIDSDHVQLRQDYAYSSLTGVPTALSEFTNDINLLDSDTVTNLVDSDYVQLRQDYAYASLTGAPTSLSEFTNDITGDFLDSDEVIDLVDSSYVRARQDFRYSELTGVPAGLLDSNTMEAIVDSDYVQDRQDYAYASLTGAPTNLSDFTNDIQDDILDSDEVVAIIDSDYIETRVKRLIGDITVRGDLVPETDGTYSLGTADKRWTDMFVGGSSIYLGKIVLTESDGRLVVRDSNNELQAEYDFAENTTDDLSEGSTNLYYTDTRVDARVNLQTGSNLDLSQKSTTDLSEGDNLYYTKVRVDSDIDAAFDAKSTTDLDEGNNLYYTRSRVDSDIAAAFTDSSGDNEVNITINNFVTDTVDSAYVLDRVNEAPFLDSADAIALIDSDYVRARSSNQTLDTTSDVTFNTVTADLNGAIEFTAKNAEGTTLTKGTVVYIKGVSGNKPTVAKADASDPTKMPAFGIVSADASNNANTIVYTFGTLYNVDTSSFSAGDTLYVSDTAGELTNVKPSGEGNLLQNIGRVIRSHGSAGSIKVGGAGRTNAVPNLDNDQFFLGNNSNYAVATDFTDAVTNVVDSDFVRARVPTDQDLRSSDSVTFSGLTVSGDLNVTGSTYSVNTIAYTVNDPLIHLADSNEQSDVVDIGFVGHYYRDGQRRHTGVFRDASNEEYYIFNGMVDSSFDSTSPPNVVDRSSTDFTLSTLNVGTIKGIYAGFDSDFTAKSTTDLSEGTNLYYTTTRANTDIDARVDAAYVQARQTHYLDSTATQNLIDASYIQSNQTDYLDSDLTTQLIDAAYVQARQTHYLDSALTTQLVDESYVQARQTHYLDSTATQNLIDASYIQSNQTDYLDSDLTTQLIDSAYVQLRQTAQDFAYASLTGAPTNVSDFANDANYLDSTTAQTLIDASYIQSNQNNIDSDLVQGMIDAELGAVNQDLLPNGDGVYDLGDSNIRWKDLYLTGSSLHLGGIKVTETDSKFKIADRSTNETIAITASNVNDKLIDSSVITSLASDLPISTFTNDANYLDSTTVKGVIDSTYIATAIETDSNVTVTIVNNIQSEVDSDYVLARVASAPFLDSELTIQLIDSDYVQLRQTAQDFAYASLTGAPTIPSLGNDFVDSAQVESIIDSAYINARTDAGTDSAATIQLIEDTVTKTFVEDLGIEAGLDSALIEQMIDSDYIALRVSGADSAINASEAINADQLDRQEGTYYLDYNNFTNTPSIPTIDKPTIDALNINADQLDGQEGSYYTNFNNLTNVPNILDSQEIQGIFNTEIEAGAVVGSKFIEFIHDGGTQTEFDVTVDNKTSAHRYQGTGSSQGYVIRNQESPFLTFVPGNTYRFNQTGSSNAGHPIRFYYDAARTSEYTTGVTTNGTPGSANAYTQIVISDDTPMVLFYQCENHGYMGNAIFVQTRNLTGFTSDDLTEGSTNLFYSDATVEALIDSAYVALHSAIGKGDVDFGSNKILYSNVYSAEGDLPSASDYHGMFAHVHGTGAAYFAHSGNWVRLANQSELFNGQYSSLTGTPDILDSALITQLIDSDYVQLRQNGDGSSGVDSSATIALIQSTVDSAYVAAREALAGGGASLAFKTISVNTQDDIVAGSAIDTLTFEAGNNITIQTDAATNTVTINSTATGSGGGGGGGGTGGSGTTVTKFVYTADSGQLIFADSDDTGDVLEYNNLETNINVYLNGVLLVDSEDFTLTDSSTVTLIDSAALGDVVQIVKFSSPTTSEGTGGGSTSGVDSAATLALIDSDYILARVGAVASGTLEVNKFYYDATASQTVFSGADKFSNTLSIDPDNIEVYLNGILQVETTDYSATASAVTFTEAVDSGYSVAIIETIGLVNTHQAMVETVYEFDADSGQTSFTGTDRGGLKTLNMADGIVNVFLNGILISEDNDYTTTDTTLTLLDAADSGDFIAIKVTSGTVASSLNTKQYVFTNKTGTTLTGGGLGFTGNVQIFKNGDPLKESEFDISNGDTITLSTAAVSSDEFIVQTFSAQDWTAKTFDFVADSGQTVFNGADRYGENLYYKEDGLIVYLNGIALVKTQDYVATNSHTITFNEGVSASDEVKIYTFIPADLTSVATPFEVTQFEYTADSGQTLFTDSDINGETLSFENGKVQVYMNGLLLRKEDFTNDSDGTEVTLTVGADSGDNITITKFVGNNIGLTESEVQALIDTSSSSSGASNASTWSEVTSNTTVEANTKNIIDCSGGAVNVTLPATPTLGDEVRVIDGTGNASTNNITILRNGNNIQGSADNLTIDIDRAAIGLVFYNATQGWILIEN